MDTRRLSLASCALLGTLALGGCDDLTTEPEVEDVFEATVAGSCIGAGEGCDVIELELDLTHETVASERIEDFFVHHLHFSGGSSWRFGSITGVFSQGTPVNWVSSIGSGGNVILLLHGEGGSSATPLRVRLNMAAFDAAGTLNQISFSGQGSTAPLTQDHDIIPFEGTVTGGS